LGKPIYVNFYFHFDFPGRGPQDPAGRRTSEAIKNSTEVFEKYGVKGQYGITGLVIQNLSEHYPEVIEKIKNMKMPIGYHGDHVHVPNPIRPQKLQGLNWLERLKTIWKYETHKLNSATGEIIPDEIGGWLGVQKILGITPLPTDVEGKGEISLHGYVLRKLGAASYSIKSCYEDEPFEDIICFPQSNEPHSYPEMERARPGHPPQYFGLNPGVDAPAEIDSIDYLQILAKIKPEDKAGRVSFMTHAQLAEKDVHKKFEEIVKFLVEDENFKIVWPDMEAEQWKPENSPPIFYEENYGINNLEEIAELEMPPKSKDKTLVQKDILQASEFLLEHWPIATHWGDLGGPPDYVDLGGRYLSLSETFQALVYSLAEYRNNGQLPEKVIVKDLYGPVDYPSCRDEELTPEKVKAQGMPTCGDSRTWYAVHSEADLNDLLDAVLEISQCMSDKIPSAVEVLMPAHLEKKKIPVKVNSAEMLYAMAQTYKIIKNKIEPNKVLFVSMKIVEEQPCGITEPRQISKDVARAAHPRQIVVRRYVDPALIHVVWSYTPPEKVSLRDISFMSTPFVDIEGIVPVWRAYNKPGEGYDVGSTYEKPRLRLPPYKLHITNL